MINQNQLDKLLALVKEKGFLAEAKEILTPKEEEQRPDEFADIKALLGTTGSAKRTDSKETLEKFKAFMSEDEDRMDEKKGIHIDAITTAVQGVEKTKNSAGKLTTEWSAATSRMRNWLRDRMTDSASITACVGAVESKGATYYYIPAEEEQEELATAGSSKGKKATKK